MQNDMLDQFVTVEITKDKLYAYMELRDAAETFQCTVEQLEAHLHKRRVVYGIQYDKLSEIADEPKILLNSPVVVAVGDKPVDGEDGYIRHLFESGSNAKKPLELEDGKVDFREISSLNNVRKGQLLAERVPAKEGLPGKAVTGETLLPRKGKEARFKLGKNVVTDASQMYLYAAIDGIVTKTENEKINVFPIFEVNGDVDYHTGNIDFVGTVIIRGNVLSGFKVMAAGDIRVYGGVESADLVAEGSIEISAGILGHNKGMIRAGKSIKTSFVQDGNLSAGEDIIVSQSIMHSQVRAGRNVICRGAKGLIVGGVIQAGEKVEARTIGNTMSTVTSIEVGVAPELRNELLELRGRLKTITENMEKTDKALVLLEQLAANGQLSPDKLALKIKLSNTKKQASDELEEIQERMKDIENALDHIDKAVVEVVSTIYPGSKIIIGRYTRFVNDAVSRAVFKLSDGDIAMLPLL